MLLQRFTKGVPPCHGLIPPIAIFVWDSKSPLPFTFVDRPTDGVRDRFLGIGPSFFPPALSPLIVTRDPIMSDVPAIDSSERFEINPLFMFRWEETQNAFVFLYPEGVVKLNDTAAEILKRCTGEATVADIVRDLARQYAADGPEAGTRIENGVRNFLEVSHAKGWIRRKA